MRPLTMSFLTVLLMTVAAKSAEADLVYAVDATNLILVDQANPGNSTIVGAHNLGTNIVPYNLAYDPFNDVLVGIATENSHPFTRRLVEFNRTTGQATVLADLGGIDVAGLHEAPEYVHSLGNFVTGRSQPNSSFAPELAQIALDGSTSGLLSTSPAIDNDFLVYDSRRDRLYSINSGSDGNTQFNEIDLQSGVVTLRGQIPTSLADDMAYSRALDSIFLVSDGFLYVADPVNYSFASLGLIPGTDVRGIAVVSSIPEPASGVGLLVLCLTTMYFQSNRRNRR